MFSSQNDQSSFANSDLSFFTKSILNSVANHSEDEIRYKTLVDYISDDFSGRPDQTPFFVTQGDYTEKFVNIDKEYAANLRSRLSKSVQSNSKATEDGDAVKSSFEKLKDFSKKLSSKETIQSFHQRFSDFEYQKFFSEDVVENYDLEVSLVASGERPTNTSSIGSFISKDNSIPPYLAKIIEENVKKRKLKRHTKSPFDGIFGLGRANAPSDPPSDEMEDVWEREIKGYSHTLDFEFHSVVIKMLPKFEMLPKFTIYINPIYSQTSVTIFSKISTMEHIGFDQYGHVSTERWSYSTVPFMRAKHDEFIGSFIKKHSISIQKFVDEEAEKIALAEEGKTEEVAKKG